MKKLLLILALFVVGCAEYNSLAECKLKETQKLAEVTESDRTLIKDYCKALVPKKCTEFIDYAEEKHNNRYIYEKKRFDILEAKLDAKFEDLQRKSYSLVHVTDDEMKEFRELMELLPFRPRNEEGYDRACGDWRD